MGAGEERAKEKECERWVGGRERERERESSIHSVYRKSIIGNELREAKCIKDTMHLIRGC